MKLLMKATGIAAAATAGLLAFMPVTATAQGGEVATLLVHKVVVGTPPPGATFKIQVACLPLEDGPKAVEEPPFSTDLTFGPTGGDQTVTIGDAGNCTVTEIDAGGANSNTGPVLVLVEDPTMYSATITNTFVASATTIAPAKTTTTVQAAAVATPRFTG